MEKCPDQVAIQGRVYADNPDQAAMEVGKKMCHSDEYDHEANEGYYRKETCPVRCG